MSCPENKGAQETLPGKANFVNTNEGELVASEKPVEYRIQGKVEGTLTELLMDTACSKTMIDASLILPEKIVEGQIALIKCSHVDKKQYPIAMMQMDINGKKCKVEAAVVKGLPRQFR